MCLPLPSKVVQRARGRASIEWIGSGKVQGEYEDAHMLRILDTQRERD